jgi:hypothetical protein
MRWPTILAGLGAVAALALGFNLIVPLSEGVDTLYDIAGVICLILFFGLADEDGARSSQFLESDPE